MTITELNKDVPAAEKLLLTCCGSNKWASLVAIQFPFKHVEELVNAATIAWYDECEEKDWLEAFTHHPKIGDIKSLESKFSTVKHLAETEQAGVLSTTTEIIEKLALKNIDYENKFGFIFLVCATGKTAAEMLRLLEDRLQNSPAEELMIAMGEQYKITIIRLRKILNDADWSIIKTSQITSHVLDTTLGKPAKDITIQLQKIGANNQWLTFCQGVTNADGRISDLLPPGRVLNKENYKAVFQTARYFSELNTASFYPVVEITFRVKDEHHYHIPLLLNPFGYTTYRGS